MLSPSNSISKKFLLHFDYVYRISLVSKKIQSSFSPSPLCAMCVTSLLCICCSSISYLYSFRGAPKGLLGQFPSQIPSVPPAKVPTKASCCLLACKGHRQSRSSLALAAACPYVASKICKAGGRNIICDRLELKYRTAMGGIWMKNHCLPVQEAVAAMGPQIPSLPCLDSLQLEGSAQPLACPSSACISSDAER